MFVDISGFTALAERLDPEDVKALGAHVSRELGDQVVRFGGTLVSVLGDAIMAVFGAPVAHEEDAERALRCALAMKASITTPDYVSAPLELHIGINTGEVMAGLVGTDEHPEYAVMGDVTNTAARLQSAAEAGQILVGPGTHEVTAHAFDYQELARIEAKGKREPVRAWSLLRGKKGAAERLVPVGPFVGRGIEIDQLEQLWNQAVEGSRALLITIFGAAGIGKSRLVREFLSRLRPGARILRGRSLPYGEATGYDAFAEQVRISAGVTDSDPASEAMRKLLDRLRDLLPADAAEETAKHLSILLGLSTEGTPDRQLLFASVRSFVEALGREAPTVLVFEDLHWSTASLLSLIEVLATRVRETPLLVLTTARPVFLETRPSWGGGLTRYVTINLEPLQEADAQRLAGALLTGSHRATDARDRLVEAGGGNPLFLEELAASLTEQAAGRSSKMPASVQAIIAARLDALSDRDRTVLQDASVIGRIFRRDTLLELTGMEGLQEALESLEMRDFIRPQPASDLGQNGEFIFKHILTMEVAYRTLPKAARRPRHATVATYLERAAGDRLREEASLIAHHWKEAGKPHRAVPFLMIAAESASRTWAKERAVDLYGEVIEILRDEGDSAILEEALLGRCRALLAYNDFGPTVQEDLDRLLARSHGRTRALALQLRGLLAFWRGDPDGTRRFAGEAVELARELADADIESRALSILGDSANVDGDVEAAAELSSRAAIRWPENARDGDYAYTCGMLGVIHYWRGEYDQALQWAQTGYGVGVEVSDLRATLHCAAHAGLALTGLARHEEALDWLERAVALGREWEPVPMQTARALNIMSGTLREMGDLAAARRVSLEGEELGRPIAFPGPRMSAAIDLLVLDLLEGDVGAAERQLPAVLEATEGIKGFHRWLFAGRLAEARSRIELLANRPQQAVAAANESLQEALAHGRLKYSSRSRATLGEALLALGKIEDAAAAFRQALADAERIGHAPSLWPVLFGLARALELLGRESEAEASRSRAQTTIEAFAGSLSEEHRPAFLASVSGLPGR
jgi:class 3 adenylate cyclase/tetratricopeptide (TPR) repeat protein